MRMTTARLLVLIGTETRDPFSSAEESLPSLDMNSSKEVFGVVQSKSEDVWISLPSVTGMLGCWIDLLICPVL